MESRLGRPLDDVRIHTDASAAQLAARLEARAFTIGQHIYFGSGEYQPGESEGRSLLAHELAHTIQSQTGPAWAQEPFLVVDRSTSPRERAARETAAAPYLYAGPRPEPAESSANSPAVVHRKPKPGKTIRVSPLVLFAVGPNDVNGARRTAERLAERIRAGTMTDDDYEVLRQAGSHFTGRALKVFDQIIKASIKDRDVLQEIARQAPPLPPGKAYIPPILITPTKPDDASAAQRIGAEHASRLRGGTVTEELRDDIESHIRFFEGRARTAYRAEIGRALEEIKTKTERHEPGERKLLETRGRLYGEGYGPTSRFEETHTEVLPVTPPKGSFAFGIAVIAEIRELKGESVSVEYYTDVSGGAEISAKIPIVKDIVDIKVGASAKAGRKKTEKEEIATVEIRGRRISRTYQVEELERDVIRKSFRSVTDETLMIGGPVRMVDPVERSLLETKTETQFGYRVTSRDDGSRREFWPSYLGRRKSQTASQQLARALRADGERLAHVLARLVGGGF